MASKSAKSERADKFEPGILVTVSGKGEKTLHLALPIFWDYKKVAKELKGLGLEQVRYLTFLKDRLGVDGLVFKVLSLSNYARKYPIEERAYAEETFVDVFLELGRRVIEECGKTKNRKRREKLR